MVTVGLAQASSQALAAPMAPQQFCAQPPHIESATADPQILAAIDRAEEYLAAGEANPRAAGQAMDALAPAMEPGRDWDAAAVARYCTAVGEALRLSSDVGPAESAAVLGRAYAAAVGAGNVAAAARSAYRLGLIELAAAAPGRRGASRGAARRGAAGVGAADDEPEDAPLPQADCAALLATPSRPLAGSALATTALTCSADSARVLGDKVTESRALLRLAALTADLAARRPLAASSYVARSRAAALAALDAALAADDPRPGGALAAASLELLAILPAEAGRSGQDPLAEALRRTDFDADARARLLAVEARWLLDAGDKAGAMKSLQQALALESAVPVPLRAAPILALMAEADPADRQGHARAAFRALNAVRAVLPRTDTLTGEPVFTTVVRPTFEAVVGILLEKVPVATDLGDIPEIQSVVEEFRQAELQSLLGRDCLPPRGANADLRLRAGEILLYPLILKDRTELLYGVAGEGSAPHFYRLAPQAGAGKALIGELVAQMVRSVAYGEDDRWRLSARRLHDLLIAPLGDRLDPGPGGREPTLIVIPSQQLGALPLAALIDDRGRFLVERTRLAVVPALSYAQPGGAAGVPAVLAASLEREVTLPAGAFPALEGTREEAQFAAADPRAKGGHNLVLDDFTEPQLARALRGRRVDIVHLATHASFNGGSRRAFVVANGAAIPIDRLRTLIAQSNTRGAQVDLLVLSACETATGDEIENLGIAGAAIQAGARSALASLWQVNDIGTRKLMEEFYRHLRAGDGKAEALRGAQLALIREGGDNADPSIWAGFTLLGGWR